jgi:DNA-binding SARP family transcriptional activator/LysM repeat protein
VRRALSGLGALAALVVFFVGLPAALVVLAGWPVPTLGAVRTAIELRYLPNELVRQIAACVAWLGWAWLLVAVLRMGIAAWQDRPVRPATGTAWLLPWVRRTTAALVVCSGLLGRSPAWSAPGSSPVAATALAAEPHHEQPVRAARSHVTLRAAPLGEGDASRDRDDRAGPARVQPVAAGPRGGTASVSSAAGQRYRVQPGDVLWDIAGKQLKDPMRWKAIWELNRGRVLVDVDGIHRVFTDPKLLRPGWELLMPAGWMATTATPTASSVTATEPSHAPAAVTVGPPTIATGGTPPTATTTPNTTATPATPATPPQSTAAPPTSGQPPARSAPYPPDTAAARSGPSKPGHGAPGPELPIEVGLPIAAGLAAGSVVLLLARMRRGQMARCRPGRRIRLPDPALGKVEAAMSAASPADPRWVDAVVRLAGDRLARIDMNCELLGLLVDGDGAELILSTPAPAAPPFETAERGWSISHSGDAPLVTAGGLLCSTPVLVSVGTTERGADLLVNLEAEGGSIDLAGAPDDVAGLAATMMLGLASAPWADGIRVLAWGDLATTGAGLDRVAQLTPELLDQAVDIAVDAGRSAADLGASGVAAARRSAPSGPWAPTVIISAVPLPAALAARTAEAAALRAGLVVAAPGQPPGSTRWTIRPEGMDVLGIRVRPHHIDDPVRAAVGALVATALAPGDVAMTDAPYSALAAERREGAGAGESLAEGTTTGEPLAAHGDKPLGDASSADESQCKASPVVDGPAQAAQTGQELQLLGPVNFVGGTDGAPRKKVIELLAYLASWPAGATTDQMTEALWPAKPPVPKTVYNLLNETRRCLGSPAGSNPLQQVGRRWMLSVPTDISRFLALVAKGRHMDALRLVRGRPYEMVGDPVWAVVQGHAASTEGMVVDVAVEVASAALAAGDRQAVEDAAKAGLAASPYHEELHDLRIRAAEQGGEHGRVRRLKAERDACLEDDVAPYDQPGLAFS